MEILQIFGALIDKPDVPRFYRELQHYYQKNNMLHEASSVSFLIENKFGKNNENPIDNSTYSEE
jgi:hypothetical protein